MQAGAYELEQTNNIVVAHVLAEQMTHLDMQELVEQLLEKHRYDNAHHFVIDLAQVEFLASSCLGSLVQFLQDMEQTRGRVTLANCQPSVAFLFKVTRLDSVFPIFDDVQEACDELLGR